MAKATSSRDFRKVNVDEYSEDMYQDNEATLDGPQHVYNEGEINSLISRAQYTVALKTLISQPPVKADSRTKIGAQQLAIKLMLNIKGSEIDKFIESIDSDSLDTLMKYVYKGFENPTDNSSAVLLTWHEKIFNIGGLGCITRVLTDRKGV